MRPNRKPRRLLRTVFAVFTLLFSAGYVASGWYEFCLWLAPDVSIRNGMIVWQESYFGYGFHPRLAVWPRELPFEIALSWRVFQDATWISMAIHHDYLFELWPIVMSLVSLTVLWYWRDWRKRLRPGHCPNCNYDLRATPDRCPECGHSAKGSAT